jgi:cytochrome c oxidase assembly protein subunit 15
LSKGLRLRQPGYDFNFPSLFSRLMNRTATYKPALAWFAALGSAWVFVLVMLGAFTTTIGAGMAFPDWPLSNGSVNPHGWLTEIDKFAEHSHRLSGTVMGLVTLTLAIWLWRKEARTWLRNLGWWALVIVIVQGVIGGQRVKLNAIHVPGFEMTLGEMLRIPHGVLAQIYVCILFAIAAGLSRLWIERNGGAAVEPRASLRRIGRWCMGLLFLQLVVATTMRHNYAGLAIPTFPFSTPDGALLPAKWDYRVALQFLHRVLAVVIGIGILGYGHRLWREKTLAPFLRGASFALAALIVLQITLGAEIIWTGRSVYVTTGHVLVGALTLASTFLVTFLIHRDSIEPTNVTRA